MTPPHPTPAVVIILGHAVEQGSEAERHLRNARGNEEMATWAYRNAPADYDRYTLVAASDIECARNAPGYLHPAPKDTP